MKISTKTLSILRGVGVGAVITAYVTLCYARFDLAFWSIITALVIDLIIIWQKFETISARIHSWLGKRNDMIVNVGAFILNIWCLHDHSFTWQHYAIASVFWIVHGHLWWNSNR